MNDGSHFGGDGGFGGSGGGAGGSTMDRRAGPPGATRRSGVRRLPDKAREGRVRGRRRRDGQRELAQPRLELPLPLSPWEARPNKSRAARERRRERPELLRDGSPKVVEGTVAPADGPGLHACAISTT